MNSSESNINKSYRKTAKTLNGANDLDPETARVFASIDETLHLTKIAEIAQVNMVVLWKSIAKLTRLGLIEDADGNVGYMGNVFMDDLKKELTKAVGPISQILLKKTAAEMNIALPHIPVEGAREFIGKLVEKIPDRKAGDDFRQNILKYI